MVLQNMESLDVVLSELRLRDKDPLIAAREAQLYFSQGVNRVFSLEYERASNESILLDSLFLKSLIVEEQDIIACVSYSCYETILANVWPNCVVTMHKGAWYVMKLFDLHAIKQSIIAQAKSVSQGSFAILDWDFFGKFYQLNRSRIISQVTSPTYLSDKF